MSTPWPLWHSGRTAIKGIVIAATGSGTGKTTITLALLAWLKAKGITAAPFKVGPDFIDPGHHALAAGRISHNLDSWMLSRQYNRELFLSQSRGAEIAVVEGVMGLFDGYDALSETGSTAQMAKWLGLPVLLIVSARGKARSAAAIVKGFETFDPDLNLAGVVFSQTGSRRHYQYLRDAVEQNCATPCLGFMPKNDGIAMPERHLGLTTAEEHALDPATLSTLVSMVDEGMDMDRLIRVLPRVNPDLSGIRDPASRLAAAPGAVKPPRTAPPAGEAPANPRIAVARDKAFCFYYPDNIRFLEAAGARIIYFSPLADDRLPEHIDGIYLGGGYPELSAERLSQKKRLLSEIRTASEGGMPIYGECGGFMFLCRSLTGMDGERAYPMAGCFDFSVEMSGRLRSLGYREVTLAKDTIIGKKGQVIRGHEFHYSSLASGSGSGAVNVYRVSDRRGQDISLKGFEVNHTLGSYLHVHFGSNPESARRFVACCAGYKRRKT